jgi:predicted metal-binding membrane protein
MPDAIRFLLKHERLVVAGSLVLVTALAAVVTVRLALDMRWMIVGDAGWDVSYFIAMFLMWLVMMVAMMVPSAAPMILAFTALPRQGRVGISAVFAAGYLTCWAAFSLTATAAQWALAQAGLLASPMMIRATPTLAAALFVGAGLYQFTPLKHACLGHCRSPLSFLVGHWRPGRAGAYRMGLDHGAYCVGCCWALMALLFAVGAMNLLWVAAIAAYVLAEKLLPAGFPIARAGAVAMIATGVFLLTRG